ncbi:MAG: hypothetical protein IPL35_05835 [Sphingobacteriales bacterium]|nr:hypothetical protein [Sphingobacteriales bacterium]
MYKEQSVREYLIYSSIFKLKVKAAESIGLDTLASFKNELEQYAANWHIATSQTGMWAKNSSRSLRT